MQDKLYQSTVALAGIVQAASLVKELAQHNTLDETAYQASIYSIFQTNPPDLFSIYNGPPGILFGLERLVNLLKTSSKSLEVNYLLSIIRLQKKISKSPKILNTLSQRVEQTQKQVNYFSLTHPIVIGSLADIYLNAISTLHMRIIVWGSQRNLSAFENMEKIRALLLAGIRSAVLWQQMGGSRLQLLLSRSKIRDTAQKILIELK